MIQRLALENRLWGAERIRGELIKLGIVVSKRTIQKYMRPVRKRRASQQNWATFVQNHAHSIWACDLLQTYDLFFKELFIFVIIEVGSRRVMHFGVTRSPTDIWLAQQLREATPWDQHPTYLIHDRDQKYGPSFAHTAIVTNIEVLKTPYRAPKANAFCERFFGSLRRECLDHVIVLNERHLDRVMREYTGYFNHARPHQGIGQRIPDVEDRAFPPSSDIPIHSRPILNGLHHDYRRAA
jgi:putative transposase